mmetsp:Transcript_28356/g.58058  ORF Transcript_28356/g.58058 Transcript_28356/m.58058 type:complete len:270 (+) Transcript_28356:72-881(+)
MLISLSFPCIASNSGSQHLPTSALLPLFLPIFCALFDRLLATQARSPLLPLFGRCRRRGGAVAHGLRLYHFLCRLFLHGLLLSELVGGEEGTAACDVGHVWEVLRQQVLSGGACQRKQFQPQGRTSSRKHFHGPKLRQALRDDSDGCLPTLVTELVVVRERDEHLRGAPVPLSFWGNKRNHALFEPTAWGRLSIEAVVADGRIPSPLFHQLCVHSESKPNVASRHTVVKIRAVEKAVLDQLQEPVRSPGGPRGVHLHRERTDGGVALDA